MAFRPYGSVRVSGRIIERYEVTPERITVRRCDEDELTRLRLLAAHLRLAGFFPSPGFAAYNLAAYLTPDA